MKIYVAVFAVLLLVGCGGKKEEDSSAVAQGRGARGATNVQSNVNPFSTDIKENVYGFIGFPGHDSAFNEMVKKFVSAAMDPDELGTVSADLQTSSGVRFKGKISLPSSVCAGGDIPQTGINITGSKLEIFIFDDKVGQSTVNDDGETVAIKAVRIFFPSALSGYIVKQDNRIQYEVNFGDSYGEVKLIGFVEGSTTKGEVKIKNSRRFDGGTPDPSEFLKLGAFLIETNAFLGCQN